MKLFALSGLLFLSLLMSPVYAAPAVSRIIPDPGQYAPFLLQPWQPGKPSVIALKDPFCPYCISALKKYTQLKNYNVYVFWAPILSERSALRSKEFFTCPAPASPEVIDAVVNVRAPRCHGPLKQDLMALNQTIIDNYRPNSVPQYWMGGRQIALSSLKLEKVVVDADSIAYSTSLKIPWSRYQSLALNRPMEQRYHLAILLPAGYPVDAQMLNKIKDNQRFNWYLGSDKVTENTLHDGFLCRYSKELCSDSSIEKYRYANKELRLLSGLNDIQKPTFILEGKVLSGRELAYLLPADLRTLFRF